MRIRMMNSMRARKRKRKSRILRIEMRREMKILF
jgi:hypothetical protein